MPVPSKPCPLLPWPPFVGAQRRGLLHRGALVLSALLATSGCAKPSKSTAASLVWPEPSPLLAAAPASGKAKKRADLTQGMAKVDPHDAAARLLRLDLLIDLLDAARFGGDDAARARLWSGLGEPQTARRGEAATRDAAARLLAEATEIEEAFGAEYLEPEQDFLSGAIMMLSVDVNPPSDAETLEIQTLAFRTLVDVGHARIADNARWRLYDHGRSVLASAVEAQPQRRIEIGLHGLYLSAEAIGPWLSDAGVHSRPALPVAQQLLDALAGALVPVTQDLRWASIAQQVLAADATTRKRFAQLWPASRAGAPAVGRVRGTGRTEHHAPMVWINDASSLVAAGQPAEQKLGRGDPRLPAQLSAAVELDGGGRILAAAAETLASPATYDFFQATAKASLSWLELAIREPRTEGGGNVITQLPLRVVRSADRGPEAQTLRESRLGVRIAGRGATLSLDGDAVDASPLSLAELERRVHQAQLAFPNAHAVRVELAPDVRWVQVVDTLAVLLGPSDDTNFALAAWWADGPPVSAQASSVAPSDAALVGELRLDARLALVGAPGSWKVDKPLVFKDRDEAALVAFLSHLQACRIEMEAPASTDLRFEFAFADGGITKATASVGEAAAARLEAVQACIDSEAKAFRLSAHRDTFVMVVQQAQPLR